MTLAPKLLDPRTGEVITISFDAISADEAASRLPTIQALLRELRRFEQFLSDMVTAEMQARGQTERRAGELLFELKPEATWVVDDDNALMELLGDAVDRGDITDEEKQKAAQTTIAFRFNHAALNSLAKRIPEVNGLRHRVEGAARLRIKQ